MKQVSFRIALVLWLVSANAIAQTSVTVERRFVLPEHGYFVIQVPRDWKSQVQQPSNHLPPTIALGQGSGTPFQVLITTIWPVRKDNPPQSLDHLRYAVEQGAQAVKAQAVESELPIVEFQGRSGPGFNFSATDRAPKPGEHKFMTQGILQVGELSVTFTILTNEGQELIVNPNVV